MNKNEMDAFIEEMKKVGDNWKPEDVERMYGDMTLEEAVSSRKGDLDSLFGMLGGTLNSVC